MIKLDKLERLRYRKT